MSMTETINKIESQQTLRTTLEKRILAFFYQEGSHWHDDGTMVLADIQLREIIPDLVHLIFNSMFVPAHLRDIPYEEIQKQATAHALRHATEE